MSLNEIEYIEKLFNERFNYLDREIMELKTEIKTANTKIDTIVVNNARRASTCPYRKTIEELKIDRDINKHNRRKMYRNLTILVAIVTLLVNIAIKYL